MTIPKEWLKQGAFVPVNNDTVDRLIRALKSVPEWAKVSHFDEYSVHVRFNVSVPFDFKNNDMRLIEALHGAINSALLDCFKANNGSYSNPRVDIERTSKHEV